MTMRTLRCIAPAALLLLLAGAPSVSAQTLEEAVAAYERGDYATAYLGFRHLAEQGDAGAKFRLGIMYKYSEGVPRDRTEAAKWFRRAAERGHSLAQLHLGYHYEFGWGVRKDYAEAVRWQRRAAEQGLGAAQFNLGTMYKEGLGVPRNLERSYIWFSIAASRFPASDGTHRHLAAQNRDRIAAHLPASIRARAQRIARMWRPGLTFDPDVPASKAVSTGSGFRVSAGGHIVTNAHVVRGCSEVRVSLSPGAAARRIAVAARDKASDLALLKGPAGAPFARFRAGRGVRPGARVVVAGYPLRGVLAAGVNISAGTVAALAGPGNDRRLIQITAPVQPGNSGGPVLDAAGNVAGVVVAKLDALKVARATGDIPQNVNFAVSAGTVRAFLDSEGVAYEASPSDTARTPEDVAAAAKGSTVLVECWK